MTKAHAYLRVSGKAQVDGDGFARQRVAIESHAVASGIAIVEWFEEKGVTGTAEWEDRPAWVEMLDRIVNNGVRAIIIERLDRLARDLMVQEHIIADLKKRGITLISVYEPDLGSTDPTRVMMRQIMGAVAQYDKAMIVLKLRGARQRAKTKNGRCEGQKPYGHYPGETTVLIEMRTLAANGVSPSLIARVFNDRGTMNRAGHAWHPYSVSRIVGVTE